MRELPNSFNRKYAIFTVEKQNVAAGTSTSAEGSNTNLHILPKTDEYEYDSSDEEDIRYYAPHFI